MGASPEGKFSDKLLNTYEVVSEGRTIKYTGIVDIGYVSGGVFGSPGDIRGRAHLKKEGGEENWELKTGLSSCSLIGKAISPNGEGGYIQKLRRKALDKKILIDPAVFSKVFGSINRELDEIYNNYVP